MRIFPPFTDAWPRVETLQSVGTASSATPGSIVWRRYPQFTDAWIPLDSIVYGLAGTSTFNPVWGAKANRMISGGFSS